MKPCLKNGNMTGSRGFSPLTNDFLAGIPAYGKEKSFVQTGNDLLFGRFYNFKQTLGKHFRS